MTMATINIIVVDLTNLIVAVTALVVAWRSHRVINTDIRPTQQATAQAVIKVTQDAAPASLPEVKAIINGAAGERQPG